MKILRWFEEAMTDYKSLDPSQKIQVDKALEKIKMMGMTTGKQLSGKLQRCHEIKQKRLGLRIIFREGTYDNTIDVIEIIVIGKREDKKAFKLAEQRLKKSSKK